MYVEVNVAAVKIKYHECFTFTHYSCDLLQLLSERKKLFNEVDFFGIQMIKVHKESR